MLRALLALSCAALAAVATVATVASAEPAPADDASVIARVVADLPNAIVTQHSRPQSLQARMAASGVPAVSVAVFRDGQLAWARAWGLRDAVTGDPVDTRTLFQAASISKPVTAVGAMLLSGDGRLALDADISQAVTGWQAPVPITPRQLLSHTAGLSVSGFAGYAAGQPVPTPAQVLAGGPPANTPAVRVDGPVGQQARYSGGGYVLLQALMTERTGVPFAAWMQSAVLGPLAMDRSSFQQPLQGQAALNAASGHRQGRPLPGRWHAYPELAAAGLWTTPTDLGRVAAALQDSLAGRPAPLLAPAAVRQMLTPQPGGYGLGWVLETRAGEPLFGHLGLNEGFEALLAASASPHSPQHAVVVMSNGQGGTALAQALLRAVARELAWAAYAPRQVVVQDLAPAALVALEGLYRGSGGRALAVEVAGGVAYLRDGGWQRAPMLPLSATRFAVENRNVDLHFSPADRAGPRSVALVGDALAAPLVRVALPLDADVGVAPLLRGSMNGWGTDLGFDPVGDRRWLLTAWLAAGPVEFKVAAADWDRLNLGAGLGAEPISPGQGVRLAPMGDNLRLVVDRPGRYRFDLSAQDPERPRLQVERLPD